MIAPCVVSLCARCSGAQGFEVRGDSAHLILRKILDHVVHDRRGAQTALNNERLLYQIVGVLSGEPRENIVAARLRAVAGGAGRNTLRSNAFFKDLLAAGREFYIASLGPRGRLRGRSLLAAAYRVRGADGQCDAAGLSKKNLGVRPGSNVNQPSSVSFLP